MSKDNAVKTVEYKEHRIVIEKDFDPDSPRNWDNAGKMVCWHRRYNLGDEQPKGTPSEWLHDQLDSLDHRMQEWLAPKLHIKGDDDWEAWDEWLDNASIDDLLNAFQMYNVVLPLYLYDHGGITMSTGSFVGRSHHGEWDSGQVGFIYISHEDIKKEWGGKYIAKGNTDKAVACLKSEVDVYDNYLTGEVYGYQITTPNGKPGDSCWGYYGDSGMEYAIQEAKSIIDHNLEKSGGVIEWYFVATDPGEDRREIHGRFEEKDAAEREHGKLQRRNYQNMTAVIGRKIGEAYIESGLIVA